MSNVNPDNKHTRILFLLKHRDYPYACDDIQYGRYSYGYLSSGLYNSAKFVCDMLHQKLGYTTKIEHARDNNHIDRLVTHFKPKICVIEAYWVVPDKFRVLARLHPHVIWVVRNHSSMPFLSLEGVVLDWSLRYMDEPNVVLACNERRTDKEFFDLISYYKSNWTKEEIANRCTLLPNYYPEHYTSKPSFNQHNDTIDISCFGGIRPLKNQLMQAVAAIQFAERHDYRLRFHINATRVEQGADPVLKNIKALFKFENHHSLIQHNWLRHKQFVHLCRKMDVGLQVTFSETFNISIADLVMSGVPVVVSSEIAWVHPQFYADPNDSNDIVAAIERAIRFNRYLPFWNPNVSRLLAYDHESKHLWHHFIQTVEGRLSVVND